jgi:anti-repressor protein
MKNIVDLPKMDGDVLVVVGEHEIGGVMQPVVNARELHKWLKNGDRFATWIKSRIKKYDFLENEDYSVVSEISETIRTYANGQRKGVVKSYQYFLTLDMAKELSMVENNEQGKKARRYFIQCERVIRGQHDSLIMQFHQALNDFKNLSDMASEAGKVLSVVGKQAKPQAKERVDMLARKLQPSLPFLSNC